MKVKYLRAAIAVFVVVFAAFVVVSLRRGATQPAPTPELKRLDPNAQMETKGGGEYNRLKEGKATASIKFGSQLSYPDGRTRLLDGVTMTLPDKNGRTVKIEAREADLTRPPDRDVGQADFSGGVTLTTSDGVTVKSSTAKYSDTDGAANIPGPVTFSKGRMRGKGVGATYDRTREVLWILDQAVVDVTPDEHGGGAAHMTAKSAGMARIEHYIKLTGGARLEGEGRLTEADETTLYLTGDNERVTQMEMRGNAKITAAPGASGGPQAMAARDIDVAYAEDGRTLQRTHLVENASVQLPGAPGGKSSRRVAAKTIDIGLGPDGQTVTNMTATENVQVDLPAEADVPARRIKSQTLVATGAPAAPGQPGGLQNAAFAGAVDYREARAANTKKNIVALNRTARSERLDVRTKPGFGDVERADFRGNVHFTDGDTIADAPVALYDVAGDRLDLTPSQAGEKGQGPHVRNPRLQVDAVRIQMTLSSQSMNADTAVRSLLQPQQDASAGAKGGTHVPSMLKQDKPVNVRANRLEYDGTNSVAVYSGTARLWQEDTTIQADRIVLDDKTGNLHATTGVRTIMALSRATPADKPKGATTTPAPEQQTTTVAEEFVYEDAKHKATYTTKAHMVGPDGDVTADRIELYLAEQGGELERAEAYGNVVSRQETRRAFGTHLTYITAKDEYTMVGVPVKVYDDTPPNCKRTTGNTLTFHKGNDTITSSGNEVANTKTESIACGTVGTEDALSAAGSNRPTFTPGALWGVPRSHGTGGSGAPALPRATERGRGAAPDRH